MTSDRKPGNYEAPLMTHGARSAVYGHRLRRTDDRRRGRCSLAPQPQALTGALFIFLSAALISLLTEEQVFVLNHGQTLDISCEFVTEQFDMFDNPVVWKKFQRQEETQVNIMGNIIDPLLATNRFEVTFDDAKPRYCLRLRIRSRRIIRLNSFIPSFISIRSPF